MPMKSRSRSRERVEKRKKHKKSRSSSSSSDKKLKRVDREKIISRDNNKNIRKPRGSVNQYALAGILIENIRTNQRLDIEEVERANTSFKKIDKTELKSTLLSDFINTSKDLEKREEYEFEQVEGEYVKVLKPFSCDLKGCGQRFKSSNELIYHIENHKKEEEIKNEKYAEEFTKKLFSSI